MSNNGWFLIHRKLFTHDIGNNPLVVALWVRLIADASYEDKDIWWEGQTINIKRGQQITSILKLSKWLRVAEGTAKRYLKSLEEIGQISIKTTNKYTIITIKNYDRYQSDREQIDTQTENKLTDKLRTKNEPRPASSNFENREQTENKLRANREQTETTNKYKEIKEYKEGGISLTKNQLAKLQNDFPYLDVPLKYEKFKVWQRSNGKTFKNSLARFRLWLLEDMEKQEKKTNAIVDDAIFKRLLPIYNAKIGAEWETKNSLIDRLNDKYPRYKYEKEWEEAKKILRAG